MINLSTGLPGAGKTLFTLAFVKELAEKEKRPVFYSGITDLSLDWQEIDAEKWMDAPDGSIIVIDECQRIFRPRGSAAKVPEYVSALETHRHKGLDIFLITQHPMLIDANVRRLTERHWHLCRRFGLQRATIFQFESCKVEPLAKTTDGRRLDWKYPREAFNYYKSAEVHTVKRRIPMVVWITLIAPLIVGALIWFFIDSHYQDGEILITKSQRERGAAGEGASTADQEAKAPSSPGRSADRKPPTPREYLESFSPRIAGLAYTAPVYDEVTRPVEAPVPVACIESASQGCRCWSQQATRLEMTEELCRNIVRKGFFLAFELKSVQEAKRQAELARSRTGNLSPSPGLNPDLNPGSISNRGEPGNFIGMIPPDTPMTLTPYAPRSPGSSSGPSTNPKLNPSLRGS